ncbi:hypothetical protein MBLNU230_g8128t1 [Neophaeotheca triangularis]
MKIILTGAHGVIGSAVLQHGLTDPQVTSVIALSRRELDADHAKLQTIIKTEFDVYDAALMKQLKGAEACVWSSALRLWSVSKSLAPVR